MDKKIIIILSIITILITTSLIGVNSEKLLNESQCNPNPIDISNNMESLDIPPIEVSKTIWDGVEWVDTITAQIDDIIKFNITITFHEYCGFKATDITVEDNLPSCLIYNRDSVIKHDGLKFIGPHWISGDERTMIWYLTKEFGIELFENSTSIQNVYIEFNATVIDITNLDGENNTVDVIWLESCCGVTRYGHDEANIIVEEAPIAPGIEIIKEVYDGLWSDSGTFYVGDDVEFKIMVSNTGDIDLTDVLVVDDLPSFLVYNDDAIPADDSSTDHHIEWILGTLNVGDSQVITYSANAISIGDDDNVANVTTFEDVSDEDNTNIIVKEYSEPIIILEKTVWNETSDQWGESITAEVGDIVRFNITVTYYGDFVLYNINITDTLPCCLVYADNADPVESGIAGNVIFWNLTSLILEDGDGYSIEFDAEVVSTGINVNRANLVANECGEDIWELEDTATVYVTGSKLFEKKVWNETSDQWEESITAEIGDIVHFKITVTYYGDFVLYNNADPVESGIAGNVIFWNLTGIVLEDGDSYSIEFDAEVVSTGINVNRANLYADECNGDIWELEDTRRRFGMRLVISGRI